MSTYVLMRVLESAPHRYDRGMRMLTFGRIDRTYDELSGLIEDGQHVLDIGCGTGALALRMAARGAIVKGIDANPEMLSIARGRVAEAGLDASVELTEAGVAELDGEPDAGYDVIVSGLCFSELSDDELGYTLAEVARMLRPGGLLLVADEVRPRGVVRRVVNAIVRAPLAFLTYVLTQQTTHSLRDLPSAIEAAGLRLVSENRTALDTFGVYIAEQTAAGER